MLVGILISQGKQEVLSINQFGIDYGKGFTTKESAENVLLYQNEPINMSNYRVTYLGDSFTTRNIYFNVRYDELDKRKHRQYIYVASKYFDEQQNGKQSCTINIENLVV
ncbi:MAG: hypothetical protein IPL21_07405 [Saprospirales bacterium]|nr:hypothetical protein [Saprospirales bacterium]